MLVYATAAQQFDEASSKLASTSLLTKDPRGTIVANPLLDIRDQAATTMEKIGRQLGLSPDHQPPRTMPDWEEWKSMAYR
jgi:phage terminase small subunit